MLANQTQIIPTYKMGNWHDIGKPPDQLFIFYKQKNIKT